MILLAAAIVFAAGGALVFLMGSKNRAVALAETPETAWIRFCLGGCLGVGWAGYHYFRKR